MGLEITSPNKAIQRTGYPRHGSCVRTRRATGAGRSWLTFCMEREEVPRRMEVPRRF